MKQWYYEMPQIFNALEDTGGYFIMRSISISQFSTYECAFGPRPHWPHRPPRVGNQFNGPTSVFGNGNQVNSPTVIINNGPGAGSTYGCHQPQRPGICLPGIPNLDIFGGIGNLLGGLPIFGGSGSIAGNGATSSWSYKGSATADAFGTSVISNCIGGKSKSYNFGGLGSYSSGSGGRALSILGGLYSETRSGGNTARDFSGVVSLLSGGLF